MGERDFVNISVPPKRTAMEHKKITMENKSFFPLFFKKMNRTPRPKKAALKMAINTPLGKLNLGPKKGNNFVKTHWLKPSPAIKRETPIIKNLRLFFIRWLLSLFFLKPVAVRSIIFIEF